MDHRTTTANGNTLSLWGFDSGTDAEARRVAAALPRDMAGLRKVATGVGDSVVVWLEPPEGAADGCRRFSPPAGYRAVDFDHFANGTVAVRLEADR